MSDGVIGSCGNEGRGGGVKGDISRRVLEVESWEGRGKGRGPYHVPSRRAICLPRIFEHHSQGMQMAATDI